MYLSNRRAGGSISTNRHRQSDQSPLHQRRSAIQSMGTSSPVAVPERSERACSVQDKEASGCCGTVRGLGIGSARAGEMFLSKFTGFLVL